MTFNSILRRASSTVAPLLIRAVGSPRTYHHAIATVKRHREKPNWNFVAPCARFCTKPKSDLNLINAVEEEINCAEKPDPQIFHHMPESFPFKIQDNPRRGAIVLTRKFGHEDIKVEVGIPEGNEDMKPTIPMVVGISKRNGPVLQFQLTGFVGGVKITNFFIKHPEDSGDQFAYEGPDFEELDENLQGDLLKYLEERGLNSSISAFLIDYMINKDSKEYLAWLESLKRFVQE